MTRKPFRLAALVLAWWGGAPRLDAAQPQCSQILQGGDAAAVASAINDPTASGEVTVCLRGTFDFGEEGTVSIDPPAGVTRMRILGLDVSTGARSVILNGLQPLKFGDSSLPDLTIENLRFGNPRGTAITILRGNERVQITRVEVDGVITYPIPEIPFPQRTGILVLSLGAISGELLIKGNTVRAGAYDPNNANDVVMPLSVGIAVRDLSGVGIYNSGPDGSVIAQNLIEPGAVANKHPIGFVCQGNGIAVSGCAGCLVRNNRIHKVAARTADQQEPHFSIGLFVGNESNDSTFLENRFSGVGHVAIDVVAPGAGPARRNAFVRNDLTGFAASIASVGLGRPDPVFGIPAGVAEDNVIMGSSGTVTGNVEGNTVRGLTPVPVGP